MAATRGGIVDKVEAHVAGGRGDPGADEIRALASLAFRELGAAAGGIQGVHRAVADRTFRALGPGAAGVRALHDAVAAAVYAGVQGSVGLAGRAVDLALARRAAGAPRALTTAPRGARAVGVLNGLLGDELERRSSALHEPMTVRMGGRAVLADRNALIPAFPAAAPRIAVFVHGLMETELAWRHGAGPGGETYGTRLERALGITPVLVRFNSGRHVSQNGRSLADLLEAVVAEWPVTVDEIALVSHSLGGLVARSACHQARERGDEWVERVRHVISLGSPHGGAPLAAAVHWAGAGLHAVPETRPFASLLRRRSAGIRDLRRGSLVDDDWLDRDPDALPAEACLEVPLLEGATHCYVAATVTRSPRHPAARLLGDCLVLESSASGGGGGRRTPFQAEDGMHLGGAHHVALLNHPAVYERLEDWLAPSA